MLPGCVPRRLRRLGAAGVRSAAKAQAMIETLTDFFHTLVQIDDYSWTILLVMVGWSALLVHIGVESKMRTALFVPGMLLGGLVSFHVARVTGFSFTGYKDANAILLSAAGIVPGFLLTVLSLLAIHWIKDRRRPLTLETRV